MLYPIGEAGTFTLEGSKPSHRIRFRSSVRVGFTCIPGKINRSLLTVALLGNRDTTKLPEKKIPHVNVTIVNIY